MNDWQDANKTKPPEGREVLVAQIAHNGHVHLYVATWMALYSSGWTTDSDERLPGVYAWMPLPKPPPIPAVSV